MIFVGFAVLLLSGIFMAIARVEPLGWAAAGYALAVLGGMLLGVALGGAS